MWVCILGNVLDGIKIYGPFQTREAAIDWGEDQGEGDWYITDLIDVPLQIAPSKHKTDKP